MRQYSINVTQPTPSFLPCNCLAILDIAMLKNTVNQISISCYSQFTLIQGQCFFDSQQSEIELQIVAGGSIFNKIWIINQIFFF